MKLHFRLKEIIVVFIIGLIIGIVIGANYL